MGLRQLSRDDTVAGALAEVRGHPANGSTAEPEHQRLVQYVGMGPDMEPHLFQIDDPAQYRYLFICSDGAYRPPASLLAQLAAEASSPRQLVERLLSFAEFLGGADDASIAVLDPQLLTRPPSQESESLRGIVRIWGPAPTQAGVLLNFVPESWSPRPGYRSPDRERTDRFEPRLPAEASGGPASPGEVRPVAPPTASAGGQKPDRVGPERPFRGKKGKKRRYAKDGPLPSGSPEAGGQVLIAVGPAHPRDDKDDGGDDHDEAPDGPSDPRTVNSDSWSRGQR